MNKYCFGIDIGTSSIKALGFLNKKRIFIKKTYNGNKPLDYLNIVKNLIDELIKKTKNNISSIAFSSQTGTYVIDNKEIIKWNEDKGKEELEKVLKTISKKEFIKEIQMVHPPLISYPLPKFLFIKKHYPKAKNVCQLKDYIVNGLTNNYVTDFYTWRGLYNFKKKDYSTKLLEKFGISFNLPKIVSPDSVIGLYKGIKIVVGLNDFYSALIGIGAIKENTYFDITGTSEHIGFITSKFINKNITSCFLNNYVSYGVTSSCGPSLSLIKKLFSSPTSSLEVFKNNPPIFLPYINGERAPIYDVNARGLFFNINDKCGNEEFIYSIYEGLSFAIFDNLYNCKIKNLIVSGGAANIMLLNEIKSVLFNSNILIPCETESSAFGAYLISKYGLNNNSLIKEITYKKLSFKNNNEIRSVLLKRFKLYKQLYIDNKENFKKIKECSL